MPFINYFLSNNQTSYTFEVNQTCSVTYNPILVYYIIPFTGSNTSLVRLSDQYSENAMVTFDLTDYQTLTTPTVQIAGYYTTAFNTSSFRTYFNITIYQCIDI
jgi:hypothetical protein